MSYIELQMWRNFTRIRTSQKDNAEAGADRGSFSSLQCNPRMRLNSTQVSNIGK